jgi:hypothetical protein
MVVLLGIASTASCDPPLGPCETSECSGEGLSCSGNKVMACTLYEGDPCTYHYLTVEDDCDDYAAGAHCSGEACVLTNERCPAGVEGFCRDERLFRCQGENVLARSELCTTLDGNHCWDSSNGGPPSGRCALEPVPCEVGGYYSSECRGDERVLCRDGYPVLIETCDGADEHCREVGPLEDRGQCAEDVQCPAEGGPVCDFDQLVECVPGSAPELLRDCRMLPGRCDVVSERSLCLTNDPFTSVDFREVKGGTYVMGPVDSPIGSFTVSDFEMMNQEVTVGDYSSCMLAGYCTPPDSACVAENTRRPDLDANLPVTCVTREQAATYCGAVLGARLPLEFEWEYAFRSGGEDITFPWGEDPASCDFAVLNIPENAIGGCGHGEPWPGCVFRRDQTVQGICDLAGNVHEWVMAPVTGVEEATRGGGFDSPDVDGRVSYEASGPSGSVGFRCVREAGG